MEIVHNDGRAGRQFRGIVCDRRDDIGRHGAVHREQVGGIGAEPRRYGPGGFDEAGPEAGRPESASSHDSQEVVPGGRAAAQLDRSTLLPAPAGPTTTVRRWPAPADSRSSSTDLVTSVVGRVVGRNFIRAKRARW